MGIIRSLFWFALFVIFTFCFVVIFQHGVTNFPDNAKTEWAELRGLTNSKPVVNIPPQVMKTNR